MRAPFPSLEHIYGFLIGLRVEVPGQYLHQPGGTRRGRGVHEGSYLLHRFVPCGARQAARNIGQFKWMYPQTKRRGIL